MFWIRTVPLSLCAILCGGLIWFVATNPSLENLTYEETPKETTFEELQPATIEINPYTGGIGTTMNNGSGMCFDYSTGHSWNC